MSLGATGRFEVEVGCRAFGRHAEVPLGQCAPSPTPSETHLFAILQRNPAYRKLWCAHAVSRFGDWLDHTAVQRWAA